MLSHIYCIFQKSHKNLLESQGISDKCGQNKFLVGGLYLLPWHENNFRHSIH